MPDRLSPLDTSFLEIEEQDEASHMHIGWAMVFDPMPDGGAPSAEEVCEQIDGRLVALPRFRARLSSPRTGGLTRPRWIADDRFDVVDHVRRVVLPAPGGDRELHDWLGDYWSHRLDRSRPLWELVLVEGMANGRWALVTKTHHCLVDGMSGVDVTNLLLDATPVPPASDASDDPPYTGGHVELPSELQIVASTAMLPLSVARAGANVLAHPGEAVRRARGVGELVVRDELVGAPHTSLNVPIGGSRRFAVARADLGELKAIRHRLGGSFNDVVLAVVTGALRRFLLQRGERLPARPLRAMVPVSVRGAGDDGALGNHVSSLFVDLPVAIDDPARRYARVVETAEALKAGAQAIGTDTVVQASGLVPPALHGPALRSTFSPRLFNLTITNVPGPPKTLYAFGAPLREVLPLVPVFAQHAVGVAVVSYAGGVYFGLNADAGSVHDLDALAEAVERSLEELRAVAAGSVEPVPHERRRGHVTHQQMARPDAAWLHMDRPTNLMVITSVMWFDEPLDGERLREVYRERLIEPYERFRQRVVESHVPLRAPRWEDDPDFDLERHIHQRALPSPGGDAELRALVGELMSTPLDHSKPLWDVYVVDGYRGGSALVSRMHHCIADGIALARVMLSLADEQPDAGIEQVVAGNGHHGPVRELVHQAQAAAGAATHAAGVLAHEGIEMAVHPRAEISHVAGEAARDARALAKILLTPGDADTVLKGEMGVGRRAAWSGELDLAEIKAIGHASGATVNDVLVTALTGGLRDYLRRRDSLVDEVRAFVPFNLRPLDQPLPSTLGNAFGLVFLALPVGIASTRERLRAVKAEMDAVKHSAEGTVAYGVLGVMGLTPPEVEKVAIDVFAAKASMVVTNVPGPQRPLFVAGTRLRGVLVWAPMAGSVAMSVSILSYDGRVTVGVMSDAGLVPDPERIVGGIDRELRKLRRLYRTD
jgi:WS/DGAT/MGAT family acyltransferase